MKLRRGRTKAILREAFADLLPAPILRRGKMGFGVPLQRWFATELRGLIEETLLSPSALLRQHVDQGYVRSLWQAHQQGSDHSHRLWTLLTFELWLRQLPLANQVEVMPQRAPAALGSSIG
jgi:asparagine synthase (glutamine-hydrolysing)